MKRIIHIHGVPMDLGANLRGVDMGPTALRIAGLVPALENLGHQVSDHDELGIRSRVALQVKDTSAKYVDEIALICGRLCGEAERSLAAGACPVFLGGDHSIATGTIAGVARHFSEQNERIGVLWFDAHADMNTPETSPSGNVHGMPLATLLGYGVDALVNVGGSGPKVDPANVFVIGARDIDVHERDIIAKAGIKVFSMKEIDVLGMAEVTRRAIEGASQGTAGIHLSFDIDGLDPEIAPGVGTPVRGGINYREAHLFMELLADTGLLTSMDIVELNPVRDVANRTAELVVHLLQSAFGRRIL